ncbi:hypothetical protein [Streptomyces xanthophaeus]
MSTVSGPCRVVAYGGRPDRCRRRLGPAVRGGGGRGRRGRGSPAADHQPLHRSPRLHFGEAWFAYARFHPLYAGRHGMAVGPDASASEEHPTVLATQSTHKLLVHGPRIPQVPHDGSAATPQGFRRPVVHLDSTVLDGRSARGRALNGALARRPMWRRPPGHRG